MPTLEVMISTYVTRMWAFNSPFTRGFNHNNTYYVSDAGDYRVTANKGLYARRYYTNAATFTQQHGGNHKSGWPDLLPNVWLPYVELSRIRSTANFLLMSHPHVLGLLHAAILLHAPIMETLHIAEILL